MESKSNRDYTKYKVDGLGEGLNKRALVFAIVQDWIERHNPTLDELVEAFPQDIQGSLGVVKPESEVSDHKRFNVKKPLKVKHGKQIVVCNQWGIGNITKFISQARYFDYNIQIETTPPSIEELDKFVEDNFWELDTYSLTEWDPAWGRFLCLGLDSRETTFNMWFYIDDQERDEGVAIAPKFLSEEKSKTWFGEPSWRIELPDNYLEEYIGPLTVVIYKSVPKSFFEDGELRWDSSDEAFSYKVNEFDDEEEGQLPEGLTRSKISEVISESLVSKLYHRIRGNVD